MRRILFITLLLILLLCPALADTLHWPSTVPVIEAETFLNDGSLGEVIIPAGVTSIEARAFAGSSLTALTLPGYTNIADDAFLDCGTITLDVPSGSPNAAYATANLQLKERILSPGTWVCGRDFQPNVYILRPTAGYVGTASVRSSSVRTYTFSGSMILRLYEGETLVLRSCTAEADYEFDQYHQLEATDGQGMLRVGTDIPEGSYSLRLSGATQGTVTWYRDAGLSVLRTQTIDQAWLDEHGTLALAEGDLIGYTGLSFSVGDRQVVRRALIICQTYASDPNYALNGPSTDARGMSNMLSRLKGTPFTCTVKTDLTSSGILSAVSSTFAGADEDDVSLFFYCGHGAYSGNLRGTDGTYVTPQALRAAMDQIPGVKVLIVDCCYSGGLLKTARFMGLDVQYTEKGTASQAAAFVSGFNSAFADSQPAALASFLAEDGEDAPTPKGFSTTPYYVLTACAADELSYERRHSINGADVYAGLFTTALCQGCGWDSLRGIPTSDAPAAVNGQITMASLYSYTKAQIDAAGLRVSQTVSGYPTASRYVLFIP